MALPDALAPPSSSVNGFEPEDSPVVNDEPKLPDAARTRDSDWEAGGQSCSYGVSSTRNAGQIVQLIKKGT